MKILDIAFKDLTRSFRSLFAVGMMVSCAAAADRFDLFCLWRRIWRDNRHSAGFGRCGECRCAASQILYWMSHWV